MKTPYLTAAACLALAALPAPLPAKSPVALPTTTNTGTDEPCGNPKLSETPWCPECEKNDPDRLRSAVGSACDASPVKAYNGNAHRAVTDLRVAGSVGNMPLEFTRFSNSRLSGRNLVHGAFGTESRGHTTTSG